MRSQLFGAEVAVESADGMSLPNPRLAKVVLDDSEVLARQGAMVAYQGAVEFTFEGTAGASALIGRGSGEAFQLAFDGAGLVVVQASEGPVVPKHNHKGVSDWPS